MTMEILGILGCLIALWLISAATKSMQKDSIRESLQEPLSHQDSSTWEIESITERTGSQSDRLPPFRVHLWNDGVHSMTDSAVEDEGKRLGAGVSDRLQEISVTSIGQLFYTPFLRQQGVVTDVQRGLGAMDWDGFQDGLGIESAATREVAWVRWDWERRGNRDEPSVMERCLLALMPTASDDRIEVVWARVTNEIVHRVVGEPTVRPKEHEGLRCIYRLVGSYQDEVRRAGL
jgi:hypothetical protein